MHTVNAVSNELEVAQPQLKSSPRNKNANNKGVDSACYGVSDQETNLVRIMTFRRPNKFTVLYKITSWNMVYLVWGMLKSTKTCNIGKVNLSFNVWLYLIILAIVLSVHPSVFTNEEYLLGTLKKSLPSVRLIYLSIYSSVVLPTYRPFVRPSYPLSFYSPIVLPTSVRLSVFCPSSVRTSVYLSI